MDTAVKCIKVQRKDVRQLSAFSKGIYFAARAYISYSKSYLIYIHVKNLICVI